MKTYLERLANRDTVGALAIWLLFVSKISFFQCCLLLLDWMQLLPNKMDVAENSHGMKVISSAIW